MNLHSDYPFWLIKDGIYNSYPKLSNDIKTEIVIIGGGITGALISHKLTQAGFEVIVLEKNHIGQGSTSASTALIQYDIDTPLFKLNKIYGEENAEKAYQLGGDAIDKLEELTNKFKDKADFKKHKSLFIASYKKHVSEILEPEFEARKKAGFNVRLLSEEELESQFGFSAPGAILSKQAASINPYKLCNYLFEEVASKGNYIFDSTEIKEIKQKGNKVFLKTFDGIKIEAKHAIVACGYESEKFLPNKVSQNNSTYAIISKPHKEKIPFINDTLIWETKSPYLYIRTTSDNRIIVGGLDEEFQNPDKRDKLITGKSKILKKKFNKLFPEINYDIDFAWAGTFSETKHGLPYIGSCNEFQILFAMGYGGNGITFSTIASEVLKNIITKSKNSAIKIFSFDRDTLKK